MKFELNSKFKIGDKVSFCTLRFGDPNAKILGKIENIYFNINEEGIRCEYAIADAFNFDSFEIYDEEELSEAILL